MKKYNFNIHTLISTFILVLFSFQVYAQRTCGSEFDLEAIRNNDPATYEQMMVIERHTQQYIENQDGFSDRLKSDIIRIPVVVHVLHRGEAIGTGFNISQEQIESQIKVLNQDFRRLNDDRSRTPHDFTSVAADAKIEFQLACRDEKNQPTTGITRTFAGQEVFFKRNGNGMTDEIATGIKFNSTGGKDAWNTNKYLNIWVCNLGGTLLGYAQSPGLGAANTDGVVVRFSAFGNTGNVVAPFHTGRTATHEIGHWLNLRHIWGDADCGNDLVNDTPTQKNSTYGCKSHPFNSDCGAHSRMFMNYMDYSDDDCMNLFTEGQKNRMLALFSTGGFRSGMSGLELQQVSDTYCNSQEAFPIEVHNLLCTPLSIPQITGPIELLYWENESRFWVRPLGNGTARIVITNGIYEAEKTIQIISAPPTTGEYVFERANGQGDVRPLIDGGTHEYSRGQPQIVVHTYADAPVTFVWELLAGTADFWTLPSGDGTRARMMFSNPSRYTYWRLTVRGSCGESQKYYAFLSVLGPNRNNRSNDHLRIAELDENVFPNPASDYISVRFDKQQQGICTAYFYSITGQLVKELNVPIESISKISIQDLPDGVYILKLITNGETMTRKFLKKTTQN